jgi:CBS domain-containing protein
MKINDVLRRKGHEVATIDGDATVAEVLALLAERDIGALVVLGPAGMAGIISERDIVRHLHELGADLLRAPAREVMTATVTTCSADETVDAAMRIMTDRRIRHLPVVGPSDSTGLAGIVSIGDVVKSRIDELETATDQLEHYIAG